MMREPTKDEYVAIIMQLIYFKQAAEGTIPACEMKKIQEAINTIRYWYQFKK